MVMHESYDKSFFYTQLYKIMQSEDALFDRFWPHNVKLFCQKNKKTKETT